MGTMHSGDCLAIPGGSPDIHQRYYFQIHIKLIFIFRSWLKILRRNVPWNGRHHRMEMFLRVQLREDIMQKRKIFIFAGWILTRKGKSLKLERNIGLNNFSFFFRFIGKMNPGHGVCYVPKNNKETPVSNYELLVAFTDSPGKVSTTTPRSVFVTSPVSKFYTPIFAQPLKSANKTSGKLAKYLFLK